MINRRRGFTLIEVLVALVIIGILTSAVMYSAGSSGDETVVKNEADYVYKLLKVMPEEAILGKKEIGLIYNNHILSFVIFDEKSGSWQNYKEGITGLRQKLDERVKIELIIEGRSANLNSSTGKPVVIFYSSGEITPFTMRVGLVNEKRKGFMIKTSGASEIVFGEEIGVEE